MGPDARRRKDPLDQPAEFTLRDRWNMVKMQWWLAALTFLIGLGMAVPHL